MPEDNLTPENLDNAAQDAANAAANAADAAQNAAEAATEGAAEGQSASDVFGQLANALAGDSTSVPEATTPVQTQPFSDPNKPAEFAQPVQYDAATQQTAYDTTTAQYTQPTQAYDPAQRAPQQAPYDPAQAQYTQPTQAYDPNQQAYGAPPAGQPYYDQQQYGQQQYGQPAAPQYANGSNPGTTPMVLGILSIVFAGLVGLVLSIIGLKKSGPVLAADPNNGRAKAGKVTSIIGLVLSILAIVFGIALIVMTMIGLSAAAENPEALIETMEQLSSYDETGELQQELDELKQELGMTEDSTTGDNTDVTSSNQGSELSEPDYGLASVIPADLFSLKATGDNEADVRALAEQVLTAVKEPSAEQQKALDEYFDKAFKLSYGATFEQFGLTKEDYTKWAAGDFQYAVQGATATDNYGWADVTIEGRDWNHFIDAYYDVLISANGDDVPDMNDSEKYYAWMGDAFKKAMDETEKVEYNASINVTKEGDTWKVDQYSLDSLYYNLYGLY